MNIIELSKSENINIVHLINQIQFFFSSHLEGGKGKGNTLFSLMLFVLHFFLFLLPFFLLTPKSINIDLSLSLSRKNTLPLPTLVSSR